MLATISDRKVGFSTNGTDIDYYEANVVTASDYYPFGMLMPGRQFGQGLNIAGGEFTETTEVNGYQVPVDLVLNTRSGSEPVEYVASGSIELVGEFESGTTDEFEAYIADESYAGTGNIGGATGTAGLYRYGFNGKEMDNDVSGSGNQYDYGFRIYNPRLGKFLSVDPLTKSYSWYTPYQFAGNKPIIAIDLDGLEEFVKTNWYDKAGKPYRSTLEFDPNANPLNGTYIHSIHNYVGADGVINATTITTENLSGLDFLNKQIGHRNVRGYIDFDVESHNSPVFQMPTETGEVSLYMEFISGAGSENTVIFDGQMIDDIKNYDIVKKMTRAIVANFLSDDGKITAGETHKVSYEMPRTKAFEIFIPGILQNTKNPNNPVYGAEHFLGSFDLTIQMLEDGKTALFTLADSKTLESQTDHQKKGNSIPRISGKKVPFGSTYQRYIWTAPLSIPSPPEISSPTATDNTTNKITVRQ